MGYNHLMSRKTNPNDYIGNRYNRLTVISVKEEMPKYVKGKKYGYKYKLECKCDCGNTKYLMYADISSGHTKSCGCLAKESLYKRNYKHGHTQNSKISPTWSSWAAMIGRCYNKTNTAFRSYGAKGIDVCPRWKGDDGFINFYYDMGDRPEGKTLDRIDGAKGYSPDNCRWATIEEQTNNQKSNVKVMWQGKQYNVSQLMKKLGIYTNSGVYYTRLKRGWTVQDTFTKPIKKERNAKD